MFETSPFSVLALIAVAVLSGCSAAPGAPPAAVAEPLLVGTTDLCRVELTKVSYDDPGADDAELVELTVTRLEPETPPTSPCTGAGEDAAPVETTLGTCGLDRLELANGGGASCETYRMIPLSEVLVPTDDVVIVCAGDSTLAAAGACDVATAGKAALRNGWLQNGPGDVLRLVGADGSRVSVEYGGSGACSSPDALQLAEESGEIPGAAGPVDDVNTWCGERFELAPADQAFLRRPNPCQVSGDGSAGAASMLPDAAPWTPPTSAPSPGPAAIASTDRGAVAPYLFDAGAAPPAQRSRPPEPGCSAASAGARSTAPGVIALLSILAGARCGSRRRRLAV